MHAARRSGLPIKPTYRADEPAGFDSEEQLGVPGSYPSPGASTPRMAEAGATPAQEVAFTLPNAKEYVRRWLPGSASTTWAAAVVLLRRHDLRRR